jgi:hypothetical protein
MSNVPKCLKWVVAIMYGYNHSIRLARSTQRYSSLSLYDKRWFCSSSSDPNNENLEAGGFAKGAVQYRNDVLMWMKGEIPPAEDILQKKKIFEQHLSKIEATVNNNGLPKFDDINQLTYHATSKESIDHIAKLFHVYRRYVRPISWRSTKPFVRACCLLGYPEIALSALLDRQNYLLMPSRNCIHLLMLRFAFEAKRPDYLKKMFISFALLDEYNIGVAGFAYYILLEGCITANTEETLDQAMICANEALSRGLHVSPSFYAVIMDICLRRQQPSEAIVWFERAVLKRSKEMYMLAASAYDALDDPRKASECREAAHTLMMKTMEKTPEINT